MYGGNVKFLLKNACKDCPFTRGNVLTHGLPRKRVVEIVEDLTGDKIFPCHKHQKGNIACAGALMFMRKLDILSANLATRMAIGFGIFNPVNLVADDSHLFNSIEELLNAYPDHD